MCIVSVHRCIKSLAFVTKALLLQSVSNQENFNFYGGEGRTGARVQNCNSDVNILSSPIPRQPIVSLMHFSLLVLNFHNRNVPS